MGEGELPHTCLCCRGCAAAARHIAPLLPSLRGASHYCCCKVHRTTVPRHVMLLLLLPWGASCCHKVHPAAVRRVAPLPPPLRGASRCFCHCHEVHHRTHLTAAAMEAGHILQRRQLEHNGPRGGGSSRSLAAW